MATVTAYLGLGCNIEPERNLPAQVSLLAGLEGVELEAVSPVYRTPPWGYADQAPFLNAAAKIRTALPPLALLDGLQAIEARLSRVRTLPNGPRTADLDLLFYGDRVIREERLQVPHPRLNERGFVLVPLRDLAPGLVHPLLQRTVAELAAEADVAGIVPVELELMAEGAVSRRSGGGKRGPGPPAGRRPG